MKDNHLNTQKGKITIRPLGRQDVEGLRALRLEALQDSPEAFGQDYEDVVEKPASFWQELAENNLGDGDGVIFLADCAGLPVGMTGVVRSPHKKMSHSAAVWGVYVQPEWRGHGIAGRLVQAGIDWAREKGLVLLKLGVVTSNQAAIHTYERRGFRACGVEPKTFNIEGIYYDLMRMVLHLDGDS